MDRYLIAGLNVDMEISGKTTIEQAAKYRIEPNGRPADITICPSKERIEEKMKKNMITSYALQEYMTTGAAFYVALIKFGGFMLHSSAVALNGKAYLFSAPSGTGKSTHTSRWVSYFGKERAVIINDDKPAIREINGEFKVMGTPWSGKTDQNENIAVPIAGIAFLKRGESNSIRRMSVNEAIKNIMWQTVRPSRPDNMEALLTTLDKFISAVPVYELTCNISDEAVETSYQAMKDGK